MIEKTQASRTVLEDCKTAASELTDGISGSAWRWRWVAISALLRAVGHVLHSERRTASPELAAAIEAWWRGILASKPCPVIFWDFIHAARNDALKEYVLHAGQSVTIHPLPFSPKSMWGTEDERPSTVPVRPPTEYSYPMTRGPFVGRDQREVIAEAIAWWQEQFDAIDADAAARAMSTTA
ncbi:hypothetical protein [Anaeromyxobacter sp. Fw109-5]|uniref:hypothetical protein n=1 Tax=Anaeromyxobacter sp. (strain Fw109-5) TaxID=404589 RepID=UPI0000ED7EBE|nr:hypothetical protein [Anaeromyxobacter sp. Fw109-5]ABS25295.1 hypothetical protein Anae109_1087 [Anaeromyxobacter sp. Fw109-5]